MGERWLTYDEMVEVMHLTKESAKVLTRKKRWPRRPGNDGRARIGVPEEAIEARRESSREGSREKDPQSPRERDPESTSPDLEEVLALRVLCARLEAQIEAMRVIAAEREEQTRRERQGLEQRAEEVAAERDRWAAQAETLAKRGRLWWPWRRSA
jgi:hypothetical protein